MSFTRLRRSLVAVGLAAAVAGSTLVPSAASAPAGRPIVKNLLSPLSVAVTDTGSVFFSENFAGKLYYRAPGKAPRVVYQTAGEVGGVSVENGVVYFIANTRVMRKAPGRPARAIADLNAFETAHNPDKGIRYGAVGLSDDCKAQWPTGPEVPPASYPGIVESHPYATAVRNGTVYVADAAANAVFRVRSGKVSTVAVLPPVQVPITAKLAASAGFPVCAIGKSYRFEGVPTDVEIRRGQLYVSSLPGGPEDGTAPGSVWRLNLATGGRTRILNGLVSATGVAVSGNGTVYVSELFAGRITRLSPAGRRSTFVRTALPSAVEVHGGYLFVTDNVLSGLAPGEAPAGRLVRYPR
ncbi:MAG TPA: ScyD/ScyE family protein [Nocardioides sp.]|nr:ScyD/ScyE family protein [Nocardioides sp.]